jgi:hypothetical protein
VCNKRELWPDRSTDNIRFGAKDAPFIRTSGTKSPSENFTIFPPILGVKWGAGMENVGKKTHEKFDYLGRYERY